MVRQNRNAFGYDGLGYVTSVLKMVALAVSEEGPYVLPSSVDTVNDGQLHALRPYTCTLPAMPNRGCEDYLDWVLTDGQALRCRSWALSR